MPPYLHKVVLSHKCGFSNFVVQLGLGETLCVVGVWPGGGHTSFECDPVPPTSGTVIRRPPWGQLDSRIPGVVGGELNGTIVVIDGAFADSPRSPLTEQSQ